MFDTVPVANASASNKSVKHLLWHGNVEEALGRIDSLFIDLDFISRRCEPAGKLARGIAECRTYIRNNRGSIPNFGERYRQGETISTAFVESTINQGSEPEVCQKVADGLDAQRSTPVVTDADAGSQQRTGGLLPALVSEIPPANSYD